MYTAQRNIIMQNRRQCWQESRWDRHHHVHLQIPALKPVALKQEPNVSSIAMPTDWWRG